MSDQDTPKSEQHDAAVSVSPTPVRAPKIAKSEPAKFERAVASVAAETPVTVPLATKPDTTPIALRAPAKVGAKVKPVPAVSAAPASKAAPATPVAPVATPAPAVPETKILPQIKPVAKKPVVANVPKAPIAKTASVTATVTATPPSAAQVRTANPNKDAKMTTETQFAEMNDRAKGVMEKSTKAVEELTAFTKGNIEAIVESSKIAAKNIEALGQDAAVYAKTSFESATAAAKSLASVKSPTEFMALQSDYARTAFDSMIAESARSTEKLLKMFGEIAQPISNRVSIATDKMKIVA